MFHTNLMFMIITRLFYTILGKANCSQNSTESEESVLTLVLSVPLPTLLGAGYSVKLIEFEIFQENMSFLYRLVRDSVLP